MFVKQIDIKNALELAAKGREIAIMAPKIPEPKAWTDYDPDTLQNLLAGCLFFRKEPALETAELTPAQPKKQKRVDRGKVMVLHKAGRSNKWIADDMGLHEGTVCRILREMKEECGDEQKDDV